MSNHKGGKENLEAAVAQIVSVGAKPVYRRSNGMDLHTGTYTVDVRIVVGATSPGAATLHVERVLLGRMGAPTLRLGEAKPAFEERSSK